MVMEVWTVSPVGKPRVKYLSADGLNWRILLRMYFAAHSLARSYSSRMTSLILSSTWRHLQDARKSPEYVLIDDQLLQHFSYV